MMSTRAARVSDLPVIQQLIRDSFLAMEDHWKTPDTLPADGFQGWVASAEKAITTELNEGMFAQWRIDII